LREVSMQRGYVQVTRRDERRPSRRGILLGLLPLTLLAAALVPSPAQADPQFEEGCRVQLTGELTETPLGPSSEGVFTFECNEEFGDVTKVVLTSSGKNFLVNIATAVPQGFACLPTSPGTEATCLSPGEPEATFDIIAQDICGVEDNDPLTFAVELKSEENDVAFDGLEIQCAAPPSGTTPPTTTTPTGTTPPPASGTPGGTAGDTGGGGAGGVRGAEDSGQVPVGGVQSGAGGTAPADDAGAGLLAAVVGLMLAATLGLGIARVRSVRG
jgi:hypothetical protein